jgi:polar amino acid transport system substrate-binding protein
MRVNKSSHRPGRWFSGLAGVLLLAALVAPASAHALSVTQSSARFNGSSGQNTYGAIPTRFTWQMLIKKGDPAVSSVRVTLPPGTKLGNTAMTVEMVQGLDRIPLKTTPVISGESINIPFVPSVEATSQSTTIRLTVQDVTFPAKGGTYSVGAVAQTSAGEKTVTSQASPIVILPMTLTLRLVTWMDKQPAIAAWNSVKFFQMFLNPQIIVSSIAVESAGWLLSIFLVAIGFPVAIPIGLALAFAKMAKLGIVRGIASAYVNVIRGTPLFLQMYIAFFGLPLMGINPNKYFLGIVVLALNSSAYLAEIFRAGIQSISKGQFEAASSLGMNYWQSMQYVVIPQTVKRVLPTMTSEFILLYKDTAMLSAVGVFELMLFSKNLSAISGNVTPYVVAAGFYLVITTPLIAYVRNLEEHLAIAEGGAAADDTKPKKQKKKPWNPASAGPEHELQASVAEHESR